MIAPLSHDDADAERRKNAMRDLDDATLREYEARVGRSNPGAPVWGDLDDPPPLPPPVHEAEYADDPERAADPAPAKDDDGIDEAGRRFLGAMTGLVLVVAVVAAIVTVVWLFYGR